MFRRIARNYIKPLISPRFGDQNGVRAAHSPAIAPPVFRTKKPKNLRQSAAEYAVQGDKIHSELIDCRNECKRTIYFGKQPSGGEIFIKIGAQRPSTKSADKSMGGYDVFFD